MTLLRALACLPTLLLGNLAPGQSPTPSQPPVHTRSTGAQPPYDFSAADALLAAELPNLGGHVAVIVQQNGTDVYRYQAGDIADDTRVRLASFTKTISAGVVLALKDEGVLTLGERLGDAYPLLFEANGLGDPTFLDCWTMRHGIKTPLPYHHSPLYTLAQSVYLIGTTGQMVFQPGTQLGYDGLGMQAVGAVAALRTGQSWEDLARTRIFDACGMPQSDYQQFSPNPAIAGGLRSSAEETIRYARMIIDRGSFAGQQVLSESSVELMFTNHTRGLPVFESPWPATHPLYPYGAEPDYAFGGWVLAENPKTQHVEEIFGAGAWGSYIWIDRRRGLTAVLITDVPPGSQASMNAALGLFGILRTEVEALQVQGLQASALGQKTRLTWSSPAPGTRSRIYASMLPIRDVFELRDAVFLGQTTQNRISVPAFEHYAVTAVFDALENEALVPGSNSLTD